MSIWDTLNHLTLQNNLSAYNVALSWEAGSTVNVSFASGFEEQIPAPEFGDDGLSAGKPGRQHVLLFDIHSNTFLCLPAQKLTNWLLLTLLTQSLMINNLTEYQDMTWPWNRKQGSGNNRQILCFDTNKPMICEGFNILWIVWLKQLLKQMGKNYL